MCDKKVKQAENDKSKKRCTMKLITGLILTLLFTGCGKTDGDTAEKN